MSQFKMRGGRRACQVLAAGLLCSLFFFGMVRPASAHAIPTRSVPDSNAHLNRPPAQVEIFFSEAVDPQFSRITVLNTQGIQVDNSDSKVDPAENTRLSVSLRSLPDGVYTVSYRAISAVDGHLVSGSYPFAIGNVDAGTLAAAQKQQSPAQQAAPGELAVRGLLYLGIAALAGGILFHQLVWRPSVAASGTSDPDPGQFDRVYRITVLSAVLLLAAATVAGVLVQAAQASGGAIPAPWSSQVMSVWLDTRYGILSIARLACLLVIAGLALPPANRWNRWASLPLLAMLGLTFSMASHAAAQPAPVLPVASDLVHLMAASVWVGGLFLFLAGLWFARRYLASGRTRLVSILIPHFSNLALVSVGLLALTGIYAWLLDIGNFHDQAFTYYGQALILKTVIALPMVGMGAYNLLVTTPRMRIASADPSAEGAARVAHFQRLLTSEAVLGIILLAWVGVFTSLPPARVSTPASGINRSLRADDLSMQLSIEPGRIGLNTFTLVVISNGVPVQNATDVILRFTPQSGSIDAEEARLTNVGGGKYALKGSFLSLLDRWQVTAIVRRVDKFDVYAGTLIDTAGSSSPGIPLNQVAAVFLAVTTLAYAFAFFMLIPRRLTWIALGQLPALLLLLASLLAFGRTAPTGPGDPVNQVAPSASSISAGKALYQANCQVCHGPEGKGDGPLGLTLNPRPADLSQHAVPGVHTDGQLFKWISGGFPGSVMTGFSDKLSEQDRWNLVNFIRTLAPKG